MRYVGVEDEQPRPDAGVEGTTVNSLDNSQLSIHHCQSFRAPTRTRTWNPLIKRVERSPYCELGSTAAAIAVESGADNERAVCTFAY
jgi:hypothetical protein